MRSDYNGHGFPDSSRFVWIAVGTGTFYNPPMGQVVTRFAPSPTGALHVGGARTALFNWAYAKRHGGKFILRLEDTDQVRSSVESARRMIADLLWLDIRWDEGPDPNSEDPIARQVGDRGPYCQSQRREIYDRYIDQLRSSGRAYEKDGAVVFRMPSHDITLHDQVLGDVTTAANQVQDLVIRKSDGFPTFHFANVIDDATMGVTHVIRAQEHLNNTHKHLALFEALGLDPPLYAHLPLIFNPDGSKMSKRDKAKVARTAAKANRLGALPTVDSTALEGFLKGDSDDLVVAMAIARELRLTLPEIDVDDFRRSGYLPEVLCNYLSLLGWNPGKDIEKFDREFLARNFGFDRVGKSNSRFDREKLFRFNADAIKAMPPAQFLNRWRGYCQQHRPDFLRGLDDSAFAKLAGAYQERSRTLAEPCQLAEFFIKPDDAVEYDRVAVEKNLTRDSAQGLSVLREFLDRIAPLSNGSFGAEAHELIRKLSEEKGIGMGKIAQPLRVALSGSTVTPPIDATLDILGKDRTQTRIRRCLELQA